MACRGFRIGHQFLVLLVTGLVVCLVPKPLGAFGESGVFNPRLLLVGNAHLDQFRSNAPARWAWELTHRTTAPARLAPDSVRADSPALLSQPFAWWIGDRDPGAFTSAEILNLQQFFALGGVLLIDDSAPNKAEFDRGARREISRVISDVAPIPIGIDHVLLRSFYLLRVREVPQAAGRISAIIRNGLTQVVFYPQDLAGALASPNADSASLPWALDGRRPREMSVRFSVNLAMYVLCGNYKDDQVHAPFLMRQRVRGP